MSRRATPRAASLAPTDAAGRLVSETVDGETVTWRYNPEGERIGYTALGTRIDYERSARGRITAPEGRYGLARDALGRRTELSMPHGASVDYAYNAGNELTDLTFSGPYSEHYRYSHDPRGRVTRWTTNAFEWRYGYDEDGQLTTADSGLASYSYRYDQAGNLTGEGQTYDAANRLQQDAEYTYAYDGQGNLTEKRNRNSGERWAYTWDGRNRLVRRAHYPDGTATSADRTSRYTYGPLGRRWSRTAGGPQERFVYVGFDRIATLDASGNPTARVTFGPRIDEPLAISRGGQTRYLHADRLGSVMAASTVNGTVATYRYSPYGRLLNEPSPVGNDFRYTGREYEGGDFYYYRARYYDAGMRRFVSRDPIGFAGGDTNLYAYVSANPASYADPFGLEVLVCNRKVSGFPYAGNHAYAWNTTTNTAEGMRGSSGSGADSNELGPQRPGVTEGDQCTVVEGSKGKEEEIMDFMRDNQNNGMWTPYMNDCHNAVQDAVENADLEYPGAPGGRFGEPSE